jgi:hypothetical protein
MSKRKVSISAMLERLQTIEQYEKPEVAFEALFYGWRKKCHHSPQTIATWRERDEMSAERARSFAAYCGYPIDRL